MHSAYRIYIYIHIVHLVLQAKSLGFCLPALLPPQAVLPPHLHAAEADLSKPGPGAFWSTKQRGKEGRLVFGAGSLKAPALCRRSFSVSEVEEAFKPEKDVNWPCAEGALEELFF